MKMLLRKPGPVRRGHPRTARRVRPVPHESERDRALAHTTGAEDGDVNVLAVPVPALLEEGLSGGEEDVVLGLQLVHALDFNTAVEKRASSFHACVGRGRGGRQCGEVGGGETAGIA